MGAMTLLVDSRSARLELARAGVVGYRKTADHYYRVGLDALRAIVIYGKSEINSDLLLACQQSGVSVVLLPGRQKGEVVHLFPHCNRYALLRMRQHRCYANPGERLAISRLIVRAKLLRQNAFLCEMGFDPVLDPAIERLDEADSIASLMGMEGAAAARYFALWQKRWPQQWQFKGRNKRPPRDPVNAMLSLCYTLALHHMGRITALRGLDLAFGFLHEALHNRPSLALDLLEPLRPIVDRWVWQWLIDRKKATIDDFYNHGVFGYRMNKNTRAVFFQDWFSEETRLLQQPARESLALILKALRKREAGTD